MYGYERRSINAGVKIVAMLLLANVEGSAQERRIGNPAGSMKQGKSLYRRFCIGCHGVRGDGQGENTPYVNPEFPKPRDFTTGLFKCRSTPSGSIPLDRDLLDTISRGVDKTAMPSWSPLTKQQRVDLLVYIKSFSSRFKKEKAEAPVEIPPETPASPESQARGLELFQTLKCAECHGPEGRGNGPSALTLRDNNGNPLVPYDFTTSIRFKCGQTDLDLARIFLTGLDGTPMPSYADYLRGSQIWDLVHYLRTLQPNSGRSVKVAQIVELKQTR
jgi:mono/diheme cytochrome c family protein